jgi:hypothetical protein
MSNDGLPTSNRAFVDSAGENNSHAAPDRSSGWAGAAGPTVA